MSTRKPLIEEEVVVKMPPKRKYKVRLKIRKTIKLEPRIIKPRR